MIEKLTDFGFQKITASEKRKRVNHVFDSVAGKYDVMNDVMSLGIHRIWKCYAVGLCAIRPNYQVLDLAAGTGDMARLIHKRLYGDGCLTLCDINASMLQLARDAFIDKGLFKGMHYVQANAETLPFADNYFDLMTIAFGFRNITDQERALQSMYSKLKYGAQLLILEFSKITMPLIDKLYHQYSFKMIPRLGKWIVGDEASYQYLVESIQQHPDQQTLANMMHDVGFDKVDYYNLSGGIVAVHSGYKL